MKEKKTSVSPTSIVLATDLQGGHREDYIRLFRSIFADTRIETFVRKLQWGDAFSRPVIFSLMLEEHFVRFFIVAALRALFGRRSAGLLFRAGEVARPVTTRHWLKRALLAILKRAPRVSVLAIVPFAADGDLCKVADGWIFDPQTWDLDAVADTRTPLGDEIKSWAAGRRVAIALGAQNAEKGFNLFCDIWLADPDLRQSHAFIAAGKVAPDSQPIARRLVDAGGMVVDRFIHDEELFDLYRRCDLVWACYAPSYNQASGILGRAFQFDVPAVVRVGSYSDTVAQIAGAPAVPVPYDAAGAAAALRAAAPPAPRRAIDTAQMRRQSISTLYRALGLCLPARC